MRFALNRALGKRYPSATSPRAAVIAGVTRAANRNFELKTGIHRKLIGPLNLERVASIPRDRVRARRQSSGRRSGATPAAG
jgi:hypothetical protein